MGKRKASHVFSAVLVYGILASLALVWMRSQHLSIARLPHTPWLGSHRPWVSIASGFALILIVVAATRMMVTRMQWARALHSEFRHILGPLTNLEIAALALTSGVGEELFFRGALHPTVGYLAASLLFGILHIGPNKRFLPWTAWAIGMGFVFGGLYEWTGCIEGCILAHVGINAMNLGFIDAYDPEQTEKRGTGSLVSSTKRSGGKLDS